LVAKSYGELRSQAIDNFRRMDDYASILFKAFLSYANTKMSDGLDSPALLGDFFSEELGLDSRDDITTRLSLTRRFYNLASKRIRDPKKQRSLLPYLED